jgi:hypothetical protein
MPTESDLVTVKLLVRDKNKYPLICFPIRGSYVGGTKIVERHTDATGHVLLKLQAQRRFSIQAYTVKNTFEHNATIDTTQASNSRQTIIGIEHTASEYMGTINVSVVDLDKCQVPAGYKRAS